MPNGDAELNPRRRLKLLLPPKAHAMLGSRAVWQPRRSAPALSGVCAV